MRPALDFGLMTPAARVIEELLVIAPEERLVVVHDRVNGDLARAFEHAGIDQKAQVERIDMEGLAARPWTTCPGDVLRALSKAAASILAVSSEDGEYNARHAIAAAAMAARARHVHMVGVSRRAFIGSMMASSARVFDLIDSVRGAIRPTSRISVKTTAGTSVEIELAPHLRWFANGHAVRPGQWINVPYGALVSSPVSVNGVYVVDAAVGGGLGARAGLLSPRPIRIVLENGRVKSVESRDVALREYVERFVAEGQGHDRIGLVGLGTNIGILSPLGEIIHDENIPGVHLALGDPMPARTGATWSSHGQLAFAIAESDVDLDGQPLVRRGRYVRFV
jgi:leucyl aminopeptidase (aminopeptidase T)